MMTARDVREHLDRLGLNQAEAAQLLGTNIRTVRRWVAPAEPGEGAPASVIPGPAQAALRAWTCLHQAGLAWRPDDTALGMGDDDGLARHRMHVMKLDELLERVRARGGPAAPWDVDLTRQRATLGALSLSFYVFANGGFAPQSYRRRDGEGADLARDGPLLEDGFACVARALERAGRPRSPALVLGAAKVVTSGEGERRVTNLVLWDAAEFPKVVVLVPVAAVRAVLGSSPALATRAELKAFANRHRARLAALAQEALEEHRPPTNALGVVEWVVSEEQLRAAGVEPPPLGPRGPLGIFIAESE